MRASRHPCSDAEHADELRRLLWKRRALRGRQVHQPVCSPESLWDVSFLDVERRGDARHHLHEPLAARGARRRPRRRHRVAHAERAHAIGSRDVPRQGRGEGGAARARCSEGHRSHRRDVVLLYRRCLVEPVRCVGRRWHCGRRRRGSAGRGGGRGYPSRGRRRGGRGRRRPGGWRRVDGGRGRRPVGEHGLARLGCSLSSPLGEGDVRDGLLLPARVRPADQLEGGHALDHGTQPAVLLLPAEVRLAERLF
mmetsp:Transcript_32873/g.100191  ORF Transcript_32873/g.100191 Transcript_32873/m.100191 type:complete len:252 (-) Transcript_32873:15-770(-)